MLVQIEKLHKIHTPVNKQCSTSMLRFIRSNIVQTKVYMCSMHIDVELGPQNAITVSSTLQ